MKVWMIFAYSICLSSVLTVSSVVSSEPLHIGNSGSFALDASNGKEEVAIDNLRKFIKDETGFENDITKQKDWQELAAKLEKKQLQLGVFQGYEFAWAREKYDKLRPVAVAANGYPYRYAIVLTRADNKATSFAGLKGQAFAISDKAQGQLRLYIDRLSQEQGKSAETFFSHIASPEGIENTLDDVVDGVVQSAVVDRIGLEAYQRRKPGRFNRLKVVAQSSAFPSPLVAYYEGALEQPMLDRFRDGLLNASRKEMGQRLLTLYKLTGFEAVPNDFDQVLMSFQKDYPSPKRAGK